MRGVEGLSSTLKGKDGSSHRFQKPSGAPEAVSLEAQNSHQEAHHVSVGSSLRFFLLLLLPLFLSSAPLLLFHPTLAVISRPRQVTRQTKRSEKGGTHAAQSLRRMNFFVCIPSNCIPSTRFLSAAACPPSSLAADFFFSPPLSAVPSLSPFCPTIGRQIPRRRGGQSWPPVYHSIYQS